MWNSPCQRMVLSHSCDMTTTMNVPAVRIVFITLTMGDVT